MMLLIHLQKKEKLIELSIRELPINVEIAVNENTMATPSPAPQPQITPFIPQEAFPLPQPTPAEEKTAAPALPVTSTHPKPIKTKKIKPKQVKATYIPAAQATNPSFSQTNNKTMSYEKIISLWFKKHKRYSNLNEHDALLRIRLDNNGKLTSYRLERSTGDNNLDQQIIDTLEAASPFPKPPADYDMNANEFLIPINTLE